MPRESKIKKQERIQEILRRLKEAYPDAHCELNYSNALELLVATILSAQCTDKQVNLVTQELFQRYTTAEDYAQSSLEELEEAIRRIGLFRNKAKNIRACCQVLVDLHGGEVPQTMEELTHLSGVGRKTANVVLGNAFGLAEGIVVDTHVARLSKRLDLTQASDPIKIEKELMEWIPREDWTLFSHWLIWHGRRCCSARTPQCEICSLRSVCPFPQKKLSV